MESQMESILKMFRNTLVLSLILVGFFNPISLVWARNENTPLSAKGQSNESLMYRMLNSTNEKNPEDISYYRFWERNQKLLWLSNPKNFMIPGAMDGANE